MIKLPNKSCFGCYGCFNACPKDAIEMKPDEYGFVHPEIDPDKCIECHLCEKICTVYHPQVLNKPLDVLAAVTHDKEELKSVASGGLCTSLGREIIRRGGVVYGCYECNYREFRHIRVDNETDLELLKKSKYVHSDIEDCYKKAKADLEQGFDVLFIGTPCQISGLFGYLRKSYDRLYTVDMICHGVPSQKMLRSQVESFHKPEINRFNEGKVQFRWKDPGFGIRFGIRFVINNKEVIRLSEWRSPYMSSFTIGISYRENCYSCPFASRDRVADLTAADFWGIGKEVKSKFKDLDGVSMVLINTEKGSKLFDSVKEVFDIERHTLEEAALRNANLRHPAPRPEKRDEFLRIFKDNGITKAAYHCIPQYRKMCNPIYRFLVTRKISVKLYSFGKKILKR